MRSLLRLRTAPAGSKRRPEHSASRPDSPTGHPFQIPAQPASVRFPHSRGRQLQCSSNQCCQGPALPRRPSQLPEPSVRRACTSQLLRHNVLPTLPRFQGFLPHSPPETGDCPYEQWRAPLERRRPLDRISSGQLPGFRALVRGRRGHPARIPMPSLPQQPTPYQLRPFAACTCNPNPEPSCDEQQLRSEQAMLVLLLLATEVIPRTSHERRAYVLFERGSAMPILDLLTDILRRPRPRHGLRHQVFPGVPLHESEDTWRPAMRRACTRSQEEV